MKQPRWWMAGALGAVVLAASLVAARPRTAAPELTPAAFLSSSRAGTERYRYQQHAIEDGFTRVGVEFPAMGEHWVSFARIMEDSFAAPRPSILIYVNVAGRPTLAGVAYTKLLRDGAQPPPFPFSGAWHEHNGAVNEESLPLAHGQHVSAGPARARDPEAPRLSILHAWTWVPNPGGPFTTDNWSLPLARSGLDTSVRVGHPALRALALADDAEDYHRLVLRVTLGLDPVEDSTAGAVIDARRARVEPLAAASRRTHALSAGEEDALAAQWDALWTDLARALPARASALASLHEKM